MRVRCLGLLVAIAVSACVADGVSSRDTVTSPQFAKRTAQKIDYSHFVVQLIPDSAIINPGDSVFVRQIVTDTTTGISHDAVEGELWGVVTSGIDARPTFPYYGLKPGVTRGSVIKIVVDRKEAGHTTVFFYDARDTTIIRLASP